MTPNSQFSSNHSVEIGHISGAMPTAIRSVTIFDTQPVLAEGIRSILAATEDLHYVGFQNCLPADHCVSGHCSDILVLDKGFGMHAILSWLADWRASSHYSPKVGVVVWGVAITESDVLRLFKSGVRGIVRKTAPVGDVLSCLRQVAGGRIWMEDYALCGDSQQRRNFRSKLTSREQQVLELVERGCRNKDIAADLGIQTGTVKIHLKHIFQKVGVQNRFGLALSDLRQHRTLSLSA